jgi:hypothetical protein
MKISERYSTAIKSSNLAVKEATTYSDTDVLGAYGIAAKTHPLAVALERLLSGDNHAAVTVVALLAVMARRHNTTNGGAMTEGQSVDVARSALAWFRHGTCTACGGHGYLPLPGAPGLSDVECLSCRGSGKIPFESQLHKSQRSTALWLLAEMEREMSKAGPAAMKAIAPSLTL